MDEWGAAIAAVEPAREAWDQQWARWWSRFFPKERRLWREYQDAFYDILDGHGLPYDEMSEVIDHLIDAAVAILEGGEHDH